MTTAQPAKSVLPRRGWKAGLAIIAALAMVSGGATAYSAAAVDENAEIIVNGGFEAGLPPWTMNQGGSLAVSSDAYSGAVSVKVTGRTATGSGPMQDLSGKVVAGQKYNLSVRVKYDAAASPATKRFIATMVYPNAKYTNLVSVTATKGQWALIQGAFTIPADQSVTSAKLFIETPYTATPSSDAATHLMDFSIDDVSLKAVAPLPPLTKTIEVVGKTPGNHNPIVSQKFGADPYALSYNGRVYIYTTNDSQMWDPDASGTVVKNTYNVQTLNVFSSADLVNWTDHGEIAVAGATGAAKWANFSWAPAATVKNIDGKDKFFLYFANNAGAIGVLTADSPVGPWTDPIGKALITSSTPGASDGKNWLFDPAVVTDDAGNGYLYFGGGAVERDPNNPKSTRVIRLGADMTSVVGSAEVVDGPAMFEATHVFKRDGKYYYSYSTNFGYNNIPRTAGYPGYGIIAYMMSDSPLGPWTPAQYKGEIIPNMQTFFGVGGNNHQSFFELNGEWYAAYHAETLGLAAVGGDASQVKGYRSTHVDKISFNADGTMVPLTATYAGPPQIANLPAYGGAIQAETLGYRKGIRTDQISAPGGVPNLAVTDVDTGDWTALSQVALGDRGAATVTAKVKALQTGASISVRSGSATGPVLGTIAVDSPVGQWADVTGSLTGATGTKDLYFTYAGPTGDLLELDSVQLRESLSVSATAGTRCAAGKAVVTATVRNDSAVAVATDVTAAGATRTVSVDPGKSAFVTISTKSASLSAGSAQIASTATVDGAAASLAGTASYPAITCNR